MTSRCRPTRPRKSSLSTSSRRRYRPRSAHAAVSTRPRTGRQSAITSVSDRAGARSTSHSARLTPSSFSAQNGATERALNGVSAFSDAGGRVLLLNEPSQASPAGLGLFGPIRSDSVTKPMAPLASQYGLSYGIGYRQHARVRHELPERLRDADGRYGTHRRRRPSGLLAAIPVRAVTPHSRRRNRQRSRRPGDRTRTASLPARGTSSLSVTRTCSRRSSSPSRQRAAGRELLEFLVTGETSPADAPRTAESGESGPGGSLVGTGTRERHRASEPDSTPAPRTAET